MKIMKKAMTALTAFLTMLSVNAVSAYATSHTPYSNPIYSDPSTFHVGQSQNIVDTAWETGHGYWRNKCNTSSVYVKNNQPFGTYVYVYGLTSNLQPVSVAGNTFSTEGLFLPGYNERRIRQLVREKGYSAMQIDFTATLNADATGLWSPDCVGYYDYLN